MKVDQTVEDRLRDALAEVVDKNADQVMKPIKRLNDEQTALAFGYACDVVNFVMHHVYQNDIDADAADDMAEDVIGDVSEWTDIGSREEVRTILMACATPDPNLFPTIDPDDMTRRVFTIAGDLLSHYRPEGMRWWEYLDQIWNYFESQPDPA